MYWFGVDWTVHVYQIPESNMPSQKDPTLELTPPLHVFSISY